MLAFLVNARYQEITRLGTAPVFPWIALYRMVGICYTINMPKVSYVSFAEVARRKADSRRRDDLLVAQGHAEAVQAKNSFWTVSPIAEQVVTLPRKSSNGSFSAHRLCLTRQSK